MTIREKMARAIEGELCAEDGWMTGTPQISQMCDELAYAALSVLTNPDDETVDMLARAVCKTGAYGDYDSAASLYRDLAMSVLEVLMK